MRIAYIAPYQGPVLVERRPTTLNRSLSNRIKIELIANLLRAKSHDVEVISQGEVVENKWVLYPSFSEPKAFHPDIPVYYASALPVRRVNGLWSDWQTLHLFKVRHRANPFDLVIVFNLKGPQMACAKHAMSRLRIPVILEYEDDRFVNVDGRKPNGLRTRYQHRSYKRFLNAVSGCVAVSPSLLAQVPEDVPKMLLRGVVGRDITSAGERSKTSKRNWVLFSGTHIESNGVAQLIQAWPSVDAIGWELHITGFGGLTEGLRRMAENLPGVTFHGLVSREKLVDLMAAAKICINPHAVSQTPGNVFAFKIIEYLAAGAHVITTPMGSLEKEIEAGITYMADNDPRTIAKDLTRAIKNRAWEQHARRFVADTYGAEAVGEAFENLLGRIVPAPAETTPSLEQVQV